MTFLDHIKTGNATKATAMIENVLKNKTLQFINEQRPEISESVYGKCEDELSEGLENNDEQE